MVTTVITTHKREPQIVERALKSVIRQTYKNIEIIVVDDSPSDYPDRCKVKKMVEGYGVRYIEHDTTKGACAARNTGLSVAKGDYIAFLDDDDEWYDNKIEKQLEKFSDDIALVYCNYDVFDVKNNLVNCRNMLLVNENVFGKLLQGNFIGSTSFPLMRRSSLVDIGGFDVLMPAAQDFDVYLRLAEKYNISFVNEALGLYYVHESDQISKNPSKKVYALERLNEKHYNYLVLHNDAYWHRLMILSGVYAVNKQFAKAMSNWIRAVRLYPFRVASNFIYLLKIFKNYAN